MATSKSKTSRRKANNRGRPRRQRKPAPLSLVNFGFKRGDENVAVAELLQRPLLLVLGDESGLKITGIYGDPTTLAVAAFKALRGLPGNGDSIDHEGLANLYDALAKQKPRELTTPIDEPIIVACRYGDSSAMVDWLQRGLERYIRSIDPTPVFAVLDKKGRYLEGTMERVKLVGEKLGVETRNGCDASNLFLGRLSDELLKLKVLPDEDELLALDLIAEPPPKRDDASLTT